MTQDEIIRMAREAGFEYAVDNERWYRFAALVAAHEREACAKFCEQGTGESVQKETLSILLMERSRIAAAIRARSNK